jgi:kynureninase
MLEKAKNLDSNDSLAVFRNEFHFPKTEKGNDFLYFSGNSLGLQCKNTEFLFLEELKKWQNHGVEGHFEEPRPWLSFHKNFEKSLATLLGSKPSEVVAMNGLTVNLNLLLLSFYQPKTERYKILIEKNAFPSDQYAVKSLVNLWFEKGLLTKTQAENAIVYLEPDEWGLYQTDSICDYLKDDIALLLLSGVNYQTGQVFDLELIAKKCKAKNIRIGLDLAHAIGNIPLDLHRWEVDFAVWCSYKYLNGGPGAVGGAFVHEKNCQDSKIPKLQGWWSNKEENRFQMRNEIDSYQTAEAWQMSNAPVMNMLGILASLQLFDQVNLTIYYQKCRQLSDFLAECIQNKLPQLKIITPLYQKSCQLSVFFEGEDKDFVKKLHQSGVIADWRNHPKGGVLRLAPVPFYNSFEDCYRLVEVIERCVE